MNLEIWIQFVAQKNNFPIGWNKNSGWINQGQLQRSTSLNKHLIFLFCWNIYMKSCNKIVHSNRGWDGLAQLYFKNFLWVVFLSNFHHIKIYFEKLHSKFFYFSYFIRLFEFWFHGFENFYSRSSTTMTFCYQICSYLLWEKKCSSDWKSFWNSRMKANFCDHLNNSFKQWKARTIFGNRMLFKLHCCVNGL